MTQDLGTLMQEIGQQARQAARDLSKIDAETKRDALMNLAQAIRQESPALIEANRQDVASAEARGLDAAMIDRLFLDEDRVEAIAKSVEAIAAQADPLGEMLERWTQPNGLQFSKVSVPIGVIGMIYESRPNVTIDAAALCIKSGNAVILRGGSEAVQSNHALYRILKGVLVSSPLPEAAVQLIPTQDRDAVGHLLGGLSGTVDLIIPRGGKGLVARVQSDARVPVLAHLDGLNHTYVHAAADLPMAVSVILNAKMRRTGVCGATETVLVDRTVASSLLSELVPKLQALRCNVRGDAESRTYVDSLSEATDEDFRTEHLAPILNVAIVDGLDAALAHISQFGSGHTEAIITSDAATAQRFLSEVDSAIVLHNASTQFADGGEFGFGAEIGIATGRLHARGPVGAKQLTSYKYQVVGDGTVRP